MIYLLIICFIIIGFLGYKLYRRNEIDTVAIDEFKAELTQLKEDIKKDQKILDLYEGKLLDLQIKCNTERNHLETARTQLDDCEKQLKSAQASYDDLVGRRMKEINAIIEEQKEQRFEELENSYEQRKQLLEKDLQETVQQYDNNAESAKIAAEQAINELIAKVKEYQDSEMFERERFESLRKPLMQYEMDKQAKLFYTIQLPEEYREDIEFLLTTVAAKVQHPDIISKLVWAQYVKPNLDDTFKRIEIKPESGIYKLTNLDSGKAYIGKSTNVKTRIADHFKSSIGINTIAHQAVHNEIRKTGFWNWTIEVITYCEKDKLSELEKYYIDFFKTQEFGFNKNSGGGG